MSNDRENLANFQTAFGLGTGGAVNPDEVDGESFVVDTDDPDLAAEEIAFEEGVEHRMTMEEAQALIGHPVKRQPVAETTELTGDVEKEEPAEKGTRAWALRLVEQRYDTPLVGTDDNGTVSGELAEARQALAVANARTEERERQRQEEAAEDALLAESEVAEVQDFNPDFYTSDDFVEHVQKSYGCSEEEARSRAGMSGLVIQDYHKNVVVPQFDRLKEAADDRHRVEMNLENKRETLANFEAARDHLSKTGQELEAVLVEQLQNHGMVDSYLGRYLSQHNNRFMATHRQSVVDAAGTVARQVIALAEEVDTGSNRPSKRAPVGEQKFSSIGRAVRRDPSTRRANAPNPDAALKAAIFNAGRPALPALMSRG